MSKQNQMAKAAEYSTAEGQLSLTGQLDQLTVTKLWSQRQQLLDACEQSNIVINLEHVDQTDTAGIAFLACLQAVASKQNLELKYINPPNQMQNLINLAGLENILSLG
jgi:anti-anti-sigma factor